MYKFHDDATINESKGVWISGMKDICTCGMRLAINVAIDDFNWYVVMLIFMMILIWDDVANEDHVNMNWCYYWWLCEYKMRLLLLLLIMSLRWDGVYIEIECWWCWKCIEMCMLCMFMGGCSDLVGCPLCGKLEWLKNLSISEGMPRLFNSSIVMYLTMPMFHTLDVVYVRGGMQWPCRMSLV